ncbi:MAG: thioredoxin family protein [Leeuwenhoekiella sp.]
MKMLKVLTAVAFLIIISAFAVENFEVAPDGYEIGDEATDFSLKNIDGKMVSLSDYNSAKGFIVIFTCNTCPFAQANESRIIALDKKFASQGYPVIAINPNNPSMQPGDSFSAMQKKAKAKGYSFPYLYDDEHEVFAQYGATKTPHVYILHKENDAYIVKYIGAIDDSARDIDNVDKKFVEEAVEALIKGDPVPVETTKAIGCSIKA